MTGVCGAVIRRTSALGPGRGGEGGRSLATRVTAGGGNLLGCGAEPQAGPEPRFCSESRGLEQAEQRWREQAGGGVSAAGGRGPPPPLPPTVYCKLVQTRLQLCNSHIQPGGVCRYPQTGPAQDRWAALAPVVQTRTTSRGSSPALLVLVQFGETRTCS